MVDPTVDPGLTAFTEQLNASASGLMHPEDLPLLVDLFLQSLTVSSGLSMESYMVRELAGQLVACLLLFLLVFPLRISSMLVVNCWILMYIPFGSREIRYSKLLQEFRLS